MAAGFYDIATSSYLWLQAVGASVKSIGPDPRSAPWMRPDPGNADALTAANPAASILLPSARSAPTQAPDPQSAPTLIPTIERAKEI